MRILHSFLPFLLLVAPIPAAASAQQESLSAANPKFDKLWQKEMLSASDFTLGCFGKRVDEQCRKRIDAYQRALAAPDIDAAGRHLVLKHALHTQAVWGANARERGDTQLALTVLQPAYAEMIRHFDGGKHFHTVVENLKLQAEVYLTLNALGRTAEAQTVLANARGAADAIYRDRAKAAGKPHAEELLHLAIIGAERLETDLAKAASEKVKRSGDTAAPAELTPLLDNEIEAWRRAATWIERSTELGLKGAMDLSPRLRMSDAQWALGNALMKKNDRKGAEQAYTQAALYSCGMVGEDFEQRIKDGKSARHSEEGFAFDRCRNAAHGLNRADGSYDRMVKQIFEAQWKERMALWDRVWSNGQSSPAE